MKRSLVFILMMVVLLSFGCSRRAEPPVSGVTETYEAFKGAFEDADSNEEKARLVENFLTSYPDSEYSGKIANWVAYYLGEKMVEMDRAFEVVKSAYDQIADPERRFEVSLALYPMARELGQPMKLTAAADELAATRPLTFSERINVVDMAEAAGEWAVSESYAAQALNRSSFDAYVADNPNRVLSYDEIMSGVRGRAETALLKQAWALANLDRLDEAQELFASVSALSHTNYIGVANTEVNTYRGRTMLKAGDVDRAIEVLEMDAVMGERDPALEVLREAYALKNGGDDGFEDYLWTSRRRLARNLDGFTLPDYSGVDHKVTGGGGNVMLLAFWFPT